MVLKIYKNKKDENKRVYVLSLTNDKGATWQDYFVNEEVANALINANVKVINHC